MQKQLREHVRDLDLPDYFEALISGDRQIVPMIYLENKNKIRDLAQQLVVLNERIRRSTNHLAEEVYPYLTQKLSHALTVESRGIGHAELNAIMTVRRVLQGGVQAAFAQTRIDGEAVST